jgi:hypothetical protein
MAKGKKYKTTSNDIQNTTQKTKDRVRQNPLQTRVELKCPRRAGSSCSTSGIRRVTIDSNPVINHE